MSATRKNDNSINISLKSKPHGAQVKRIIADWRSDESVVIGTEVCRRIHLVERLESSPQMKTIIELFTKVQERLGENATPQDVDLALSDVLQLREDWVMAYLFNRPLPLTKEELTWSNASLEPKSTVSQPVPAEPVVVKETLKAESKVAPVAPPVPPVQQEPEAEAVTAPPSNVPDASVNSNPIPVEDKSFEFHEYPKASAPAVSQAKPIPPRTFITGGNKLK